MYGNVVVEDTSDVTLCRVCWDEEDGLAKANGKHGNADSKPEPSDAAESGGALLHVT
jgi:hypothetical protein